MSPQNPYFTGFYGGDFYFYTISKVLISLALFNYENNSQDISVVWKIILLKKADEEQRRLPIVVCLGMRPQGCCRPNTTMTGSHSKIFI